LSLRPIPLSPKAVNVLEMDNLYDVEIDEPGNQLLVTKKFQILDGEVQQIGDGLLVAKLARGFRLPRQAGLGYVISLDAPTSSTPKRFLAAAIELEDIELDVERREYYYVDRETQNVVVSDLDSGNIRRSRAMAVPFNGSPLLALLRQQDLFLVAWENGGVCIIDRNTLERKSTCFPHESWLPLEDEENGVFYLVHEDEIVGIDPMAGRMSPRVEGPASKIRMFLSEKRRELYAPGAKDGKVWVYSTPDLRLLRKIPAQFGVRAVAVDEEHDLLLAASAVTGYVSVIDLNTNETIQRHYIGKYCRNMALDTSRRRAYVVITKLGLFMLTY